METIIEGKLTRGLGRLHVSPHGLALVEEGGVVLGTARYEEVTDVAAEQRGRRGAVVVRFADRAEWRLNGLHPLQAGYAAELIREQLAALQRRALPLYSQPQALGQVQAQADSLLATAPRAAVELLDFLLAQAALHGASDLHLEPFPGALRARLRVDGVLNDVLQLPDLWAPRLFARLKILANLAVYRSDVPQEGRLAVRLPDRTVDVRVTLLPTLHGEKAVLRLFDPSRTLLGLDQLGMSPPVLEAWRGHLQRPQGLLLLTGPSNHGKTTTLYASLAHLHEHRRDLSNLCTVEDPVEYDLRVVNQTQVNNAVGLTFAAGLRTVLRQDPEVIMIGEIRDEETAGIALRAGLTGHLILSTVHAPSAAGVFARLVDLGREPSLVAGAVSAVLAQRLIRTLCAECRRPQPPGPLQRERLGLEREEAGAEWHGPGGCAACGGAGYRGRTGVFELLEVTDALREALRDGRPLEPAAPRGGLRADALAKARAGLTSLDEVERVVG